MIWPFTRRNRKRRILRRRPTVERLEDRTLLASSIVNVEGRGGDSDIDDNVCDSDLETFGNQCTFDAALNLAEDGDSITFTIPTLDLTFDSPNISVRITIDGGDRLQVNGDIRLFASSSTVRNLSIAGFIRVFDASDTIIRNNQISTGGISYSTSNEERVTRNKVIENQLTEGATIGTSPGISETEIKGNRLMGGWIALLSGDHHVIENNTILGSTEHAIVLGDETTDSTIQGNYVGVDPDTNQVVALAQGKDGISINGRRHTIIGNTVGGTRIGITLSARAAANGIGGGHQLYGNLVGTDSTGTLDFGNVVGIAFQGQNNTIGSPSNGSGNIVAFSDNAGVASFSSPAGNSIRGNSIFNNGELGIDLSFDAQESPVLTQHCDGTAQITLKSTPGKTFTIDIYSNAQADPSGSGEGQAYLESILLSTDPITGVGIARPIFRPGEGRTLSATATDEDGNTSEFSRLEVRPPVFLLPGIGGTFATDESHKDWIVTRGVAPETLREDPIGLTYTDLIQTLTNVGYVRGTDLFVVNYDWRMPPAPDDKTADGRITGLTAADISRDRAGGEYRSGVDYLGEALRMAAEDRTLACPGAPPLESVDVIAHSTGGLVTRGYIQSDAYNGEYELGTGKLLPKINRFIMLDVPNQGASKPWRPMHDDWNIDLSFRFLSNFVQAAWKKLEISGNTIHGPDYDIERGSFLDTDKVKYVDTSVGTAFERNSNLVDFINLYIPTLKTLLATYDFLDRGDGAGVTNVNNTDDSNWLALDLNGPFDPNGNLVPDTANAFVGLVGQVIAVYGDEEQTITTVEEKVYAGGLFSIAPNRFSILNYVDNDVKAGETYWVDISTLPDGTTPAMGDATVPRVSLVGQFENDARVIKSRWDKGVNTNDSVKHVDIVMNRDVQRAILRFLGNDPTNVAISYDSQRTVTSLWDGYSLISDPVEAILTDADGNRLGYSQATGALAEIPNSVYLGEEDGIGFVFGPVATPLRLDLTGLGEDYFVEVSGQQGDNVVEFERSGTLAVGEVKSFAIPLTTSDTTAPSTISFQRQVPSSTPTDADTLVFRATFSEMVTGVDSLDFSVNGATTATVIGITTVTNSVYDVTISGGNLANFNGTVGLNLSDSQNITDLAGNALPSVEPGTDETYLIQRFDFGDLPDSYATLLASDGARHALGSHLFLGALADSDLGGQPDDAAGLDGTGGDDNDADGDDEDGVTLLSSLVTTSSSSTTASARIVASAAAKLDAWIDFNANGVFDHPAEHLNGGVSGDVSGGTNIFTFAVPAGSAVGTVGARLRLSSTGGLAPTGAAGDGEVEDYLAVLLDGDAAEKADIEIGLPIAGALDVIADGNEVVVRVGVLELFRSLGASLNQLYVLGTDGDDMLNVANLDAIFSGLIGGDVGTGNDTLRLTGSGQELDLTQVAESDIQELEAIDITGNGDNSLTLDAAKVLSLSSTTDTLRVRHDDDDVVNYGAGWSVEIPQIIAGQFIHVLEQSGATLEVANTTPFLNPFLALDVNRDRSVSPLDALIIINQLNSTGSGPLATPMSGAGLVEFFYIDTNGDRFVAPVDVLRVVNFLNDPTTNTEGESVAAPAGVDLIAPFGSSSISIIANQEPCPIGSATTRDSTLLTVRPSPAVWVSQPTLLRPVSRRPANGVADDIGLFDSIDAFFAS